MQGSEAMTELLCSDPRLPGQGENNKIKPAQV
jgi:hypothetical protein